MIHNTPLLCPAEESFVERPESALCLLLDRRRVPPVCRPFHRDANLLELFVRQSRAGRALLLCEASKPLRPLQVRRLASRVRARCDVLGERTAHLVVCLEGHPQGTPVDIGTGEEAGEDVCVLLISLRWDLIVTSANMAGLPRSPALHLSPDGASSHGPV